VAAPAFASVIGYASCFSGALDAGVRAPAWDITFLGRDTPVAAVRKAADAVHADAIVLAAVMPESIAAAVDDLTALMETHSVVVGGPAADRDACALPAPRLLRPDLVGAARALTLATPAAQRGRGPDRAGARAPQPGSLSARA